MLSPAMGGGANSIAMNPFNTAFHETLCAFGSLGPRNVVNAFLHPNASGNYMFPFSLVKKFCTSPYCLYVAGLKHPLHKTTLNSPYIERTTNTSFGEKEKSPKSSDLPNPFGSSSSSSGTSKSPFGSSSSSTPKSTDKFDETSGDWDASGI